MEDKAVERVFKDYAVGEAVATIYYTEPFATKDIDKSYKNIAVKILRPEYLMAIFLEVYRPKDRDKLIKLLDQAKIDKTLLMDVLVRYNLDKKFDDFREKYYG